MKEPKASDLRYNKKKTAEVRKPASQGKKIRITIYLDEEVVAKLKKEAVSRGGKYQSLLNSILSQALANRTSEVERIERLERELKELKKKVAA